MRRQISSKTVYFRAMNDCASLEFWSALSVIIILYKEYKWTILNRSDYYMVFFGVSLFRMAYWLCTSLAKSACCSESTRRPHKGETFDNSCGLRGFLFLSETKASEETSYSCVYRLCISCVFCQFLATDREREKFSVVTTFYLWKMDYKLRFSANFDFDLPIYFI